MLRRVLAWLPAVLGMAAIWWFSSNPVPDPVAPRFAFGDKVAHAIGYAGLATLTSLGAIQGAQPPRRDRGTFLVAFAVAAAYGVLDEVHQSFVPSRSADVLDAVADAVGAGLGAGLVHLVGRRRSPPPPTTESP